MEEKVIIVLKEALEMEDEEIKLTDNFKEYSQWDSLSQLSLIAALDENFGVTIETKELEQINTVADLIQEIEKRMK